MAYYRLVFLEGTAAKLGTVTVELSAFRAAIRTRAHVDLTVSPFSDYERRIASKTSYAASQELGREMRVSGVEVFIYVSARDAERGKNIGLFTPAFARRTPVALTTWVCTASPARVEISKKDVFRKQRYAFDRADFEVGGSLPTPAL